MSVFEDRLWEELVREHSDELLHGGPAEPPHRRARRRAPALALAGALAAAAVALALWLGGGVSQPAYAVTQHPDGTVTVTLRRLAGVQGADARLAQLGVAVRTVAIEAGCHVELSRFHVARVSPRAFARIRQLTRGSAGSASPSVTVQPSAIPQGDTLLLAARAAGRGLIGLHAALYSGATPPCLPPPAGSSG